MMTVQQMCTADSICFELFQNPLCKVGQVNDIFVVHSQNKGDGHQFCHRSSLGLSALYLNLHCMSDDLINKCSTLVHHENISLLCNHYAAAAAAAATY